MESTHNPYQPPKSKSGDLEQPLALVPAGRGRRFLNLIIDYLFYFLLAILLGVIVSLIWGEAGVKVITDIPDLVLGVGIFLLYYVPLEATYGRTVGKWITGTKVVNQNGGKPSVGQIIGRTICRFIPFEPFSFFTSDIRGWHDRVPRTYVVKCR
ncbi:MAG: RDD family protein [Gammaproteobacteria bacterium]|nr:RDD family protein [Gammaproteobacteria bacterium]